MTKTSSSLYKLRVLKTWVSSDPCVIFQCSPGGPREGSILPKKIHLILDLRQQSFGARLLAEKPSDADANHAFIQILRKQCPNFTLKSILQEEKSGDLWLQLLAGAESTGPWLIRLASSKPPLASLIAPDQTIYVSFGQKGTFTKKHKSDFILPRQDCKDILPQLLQELAGLEINSLSEREDFPKNASPTDHISKAQRDLAGRLKRKLKTSKKTLEKLQKDLPSAESVRALEETAIFLQSYAWMVQPEAFSLHLEQAVTGLDHELAIELEPDLSTGKNIEKHFTLFHKARRGREMGQKQLDLALDHHHNLETDLELLLREQKTDIELQSLARKYRLPELQLISSKSQNPIEGASKPFKTYLASTGHSLLVGKTALENDELTKAARSNDYWLHAVGVTGSHVIVPVTPDIRASLPTQVLREAAILALYFSKLRDDQAGECYITRKAHLKKQRGMPAGLWRIDKSETLFFRYTNEELQTILQTVRV